jgi:hypothetical protein
MTRTDELTALLLDGLLSEAEWRELEAILAADPAAEGDHAALLDLEGVLRGLRTDFDLSESTLALVTAAQADKTAKAVLAEIAARPAPAWARSRPVAVPRASRRWAAALGGLAAVGAALIIGVWLGSRTADAPPAPTMEHDNRELAGAEPAAARLTSSLGSVELLTPQGDVLPAVEGRRVPPGHTLRTVGEDSIASVEMPDRTTVEIAPDSIVRFVAMGSATSKPRLFLAEGQLTAAVPEGNADRRLVVGTGVAEVFTHAGMFVVSSAGPESARVDVKRGNVDVVRMDARTRIPVSSGAAIVQSGLERVVIEPTTRIDRIPARTLAFPNAREATFSPDGREVWVASPRQLTRWTRDGGTADVALPPRKGGGYGPAVAFSPDKAFLAASVITNTATKDEKVLVRTSPGGDDLRELNFKLSEARFWAIAPGAAWFATADVRPNQKRLRVFDGVTGLERFAREFEEVVGCVASSADGRALAASLSDPGRGNTRVLMLDAQNGDRLGTLPTQKKGVTSLLFAADGEHLAVGFNGLVQVWNVRTRELEKSIAGFERLVTSLAFSPNGKLLAAGTQDGQVWVWSLATGKAVQLIEVGSRGVRSLSFSPDGKRLLTAANNAPVALWDVADRETSTELQ